MKKIVLLIVLLTFMGGLFLCVNVACLYADSPMPASENMEIFSNNQSFVADMNEQQQKTTIYSIHQNGKRTKLWEIESWFRGATVSNDGKYLAIPFAGMSLLPLDYQEDQVMLKMVKEGEELWVVRLNELIENFNSLESTASHFYWGECLGFNAENGYMIETVEGKYFIINNETGAILRGDE